MTTNDNVYTTLHGCKVQMTFDPLLPIGNDNENLDWTLSSSLQNVTVSDMEVMANAFTRLVAIVNRFADATVSSSRLHGDLLDRLNRTGIESEGIGLCLAGRKRRSRRDLPQFSESPTFRLCRTSFLRTGTGNPLLQKSPN